MTEETIYYSETLSRQSMHYSAQLFTFSEAEPVLQIVNHAAGETRTTKPALDPHDLEMLKFALKTLTDREFEDVAQMAYDIQVIDIDKLKSLLGSLWVNPDELLAKTSTPCADLEGLMP